MYFHLLDYLNIFVHAVVYIYAYVHVLTYIQYIFYRDPKPASTMYLFTGDLFTTFLILKVVDNKKIKIQR